MFRKIENFQKFVGMLLKTLILSVFLLLSWLTCDWSPDKKLLTFYYHADDSQKRAVISKLIKKFEKATDINVDVKEYFSDDLTKILNKTNSSIDVIEIDISDVVDMIESGHLLNLDSIFENSKYSFNKASKKNIMPWIIDYYLLFYNKNIIDKYPEIKIPLKNISELVNYSRVTDSSGIRGFGMVLNDNKNSLNFLISLLTLNDTKLEFEADSINLKNQPAIMTFEYIQTLSKYSFLGTQKEIENAIVYGKLTFCFGNTQFIKKANRLNNSISYQPIKNPDNDKNLYFHRSFLAISKKSTKIGNSLKLINFLTSDSTIKESRHHLLDNVTFDSNENFKIPQLEQGAIQLLNNNIAYEIDRALYSLIFEQDSIYNIIEKTNRKINKLLNIKKHKKYRY